jgi:hypothetical protein
VIGLSWPLPQLFDDGELERRLFITAACAPGLTIKDRLRVLQPNDPDSYYASRETVPNDMLDDVNRAKIVITNFHAFMLRERVELSKGGRQLLQGRVGEELNTQETEGQMLQRVMPDLMAMKNILFINDEAHHCYREKPPKADDEELKGDERKEAEKANEAARVWISGLEAVNRKLGNDMPMYRNLWEHIRSKMPRKGRGSAGSLNPLELPPQLMTALDALYGLYVKTFDLWQKASRFRRASSSSATTRRPPSSCPARPCWKTAAQEASTADDALSASAALAIFGRSNSHELHEFRLRSTVQLHGLNIYLLLASRRSNEANLTYLSYKHLIEFISFPLRSFSSRRRLNLGVNSINMTVRLRGRTRILERRLIARRGKRWEIKMPDQLDRVPLADAIASLRKQIREAASRAQGLAAGEPRFRIEKAEIELTVVAEDSATAGGEVGWWVFKAKAGITAKDATTNKVKLTLNLGDIEVAGDQPTA